MPLWEVGISTLPIMVQVGADNRSDHTYSQPIREQVSLLKERKIREDVFENLDSYGYWSRFMTEADAIWPEFNLPRWVKTAAASMSRNLRMKGGCHKCMEKGKMDELVVILNRGIYEMCCDIWKLYIKFSKDCKGYVFDECALEIPSFDNFQYFMMGSEFMKQLWSGNLRKRIPISLKSKTRKNYQLLIREEPMTDQLISECSLRTADWSDEVVTQRTIAVTGFILDHLQSLKATIEIYNYQQLLLSAH